MQDFLKIWSRTKVFFFFLFVYWVVRGSGFVCKQGRVYCWRWKGACVFRHEYQVPSVPLSLRFLCSYGFELPYWNISYVQFTMKRFFLVFDYVSKA